MSAPAHKLRCAAFGVQFVLAADSADLLAAMQERAPWGTEVVASEGGGVAVQFAVRCCGEGYRMTTSGGPVAEAREAEEALGNYAHEVMLYVAENAPERVFVHAGVVAARGGGLLLPGMSFAGKTTLVAELVRAGATYYSDEYALIDSRGWVHPYPRALALRISGSEKQTPTDVETLGGVAGVEPLRVTHVVFTQYAPGAVWNPEQVSGGMAALEMLRHAVPVRRTPQRVMEALARMLDGANVLQSPRGEAKETACALLAMLQSEAAE
jgi:hypothetical protein